MQGGMKDRRKGSEDKLTPRYRESRAPFQSCTILASDAWREGAEQGFNNSYASASLACWKWYIYLTSGGQILSVMSLFFSLDMPFLE